MTRLDVGGRRRRKERRHAAEEDEGEREEERENGKTDVEGVRKIYMHRQRCELIHNEWMEGSVHTDHW